MRIHLLRFLQVGALALASPRATAEAQDTSAVRTHTGRIVGLFDDAGRPLEGVDVVDRIGGGTIRTQRSGLIGVGALASQHDSAVVTVRKIGYADTTVLVMVGARDTVPMQIFLRRATALEQVTITARETEHLPFYLNDFEERLNGARWNGAKTFTPAEFRKQDGLRLFDVLFAKGVGSGRRQCLLIYRDGVQWIPPDIERGSAGVPKEDADNFDAAVFYTIAQMPSDLSHTCRAELRTNANPRRPNNSAAHCCSTRATRSDGGRPLRRVTLTGLVCLVALACRGHEPRDRVIIETLPTCNRAITVISVRLPAADACRLATNVRHEVAVGSGSEHGVPPSDTALLDSALVLENTLESVDGDPTRYSWWVTFRPRGRPSSVGARIDRVSGAMVIAHEEPLTIWPTRVQP